MKNAYRLPGRLLLALLLLVTGHLAQAQAPANDNPCSATVLQPNGSLCTSPTTSTNLNATTTNPNGYTNPSTTAGCGTATTPRDVWFQFTTAASGPSSFGASVTVTGNPAGSVRLFSAASCAGPFTQVACSASGAVNSVAPRLTTGSLAPNTTYYVAVAGYGSNDTQGPFTICVTDGPGSPTCGAPVVNSAGITFPTPTSVSIPFTPGLNSAAPYLVTLTCTGQPTLTASVSASPAVVTGLVPGGTYNVSIANACPTGGQASGVGYFNAPIPNDEPCNAVMLTPAVACAPTTGSLVGATRSAQTPGGSCATGTFTRDVWYKFTTPATGTGSTYASVQVTNYAREVRMYSAPSCSGAMTQLGCSTGITSGNPLPTPALNVSTLTPNTTYYISIGLDGAFGNGIPLFFTVCVTTAPPCNILMNPPAVFSTTSTGALLAYGANGTNISGYQLTYTPAGGTPTVISNGTGRTQLTGLTPGTQYTVTLVALCTGGGQSAPVSTTFTTTTIPAPANEVPCAAVPLTISSTCVPVSGTTVGAVGSQVYTGTTAPNTCGTANPYANVWYTFTTATSGPSSTGALLSVTGTGAGALWVFSAPSCNGPFTYVACSASAPTGTNTPPAPPLALSSLLPGTTYYVRVSAYQSFGANAGTGPFTICATPPSACANPINVAIGSITQTSAQLTFTAIAGNTGYTVSYGPAGGPQTAIVPVPTTSPVALPGLTAGLNYTVTLQAVCPAGTGLPIMLSFTAGTPSGGSNDECAGATPIPSIGLGACGTPVVSTNAGATGSVGVSTALCNGGGNTVSDDVWFSVVVPANGVVTVSTAAVTGSSFRDSVLGLYTGSCGFLNQVACNDDFNGNFSQATATGLVPGSTLYARVWSFNNTPTGAFSICAQTTAPCPAVTAIQPSSITFTSGAVSWSGPSNASSYVVTLTPTGGPASSQTVTASPVFYSNLTQNTTYTVSIVVNCGGGLTSLPATATFTTPALCPAVTNAFVQNATITATTATLTFTPPATGTGSSYVVTLTSTTAPTLTFTGTASPILLTGLTPGATYAAAVVATCLPGQTSPTATATFTTTPPPPANDECAGAIPLTSNATCVPVAGTVAGATQSLAATANCFAGNVGAYDVWYSFVAAYSSQLLSMTGSNFGMAVEVRTGTCAGSNSLACVTLNNSAAALPVSGLTVGTTYYVRVYSGNAIIGTNAAFTLCLTPITGYCILNLGGACGGSDLTNVNMPGTPLNNTVAPCVGPPFPTTYYTAYPAGGSTTATLTAGTTASIQVTTNGRSDVSAWVDYNHDFAFDANEWVQVIANSIANLPATATLTVPAGATPGLTMLRLRSRTTGTGNGAGDACTRFNSGVTQDYPVTIARSTATHESALAATVGLYPNPATADVTLALPAPLSQQASTAVLLNALGQEVLRVALPAAPAGLTRPLAVGHLAKGVYSLRLATAAGVVTKRLVLE